VDCALSANVIAAMPMCRLRKKTDLIFETIPVCPCFVVRDGNWAFEAFQTFSLDRREELPIRKLLLDRFLACMKPASIT
jgi:hypothetical protein